MGPARDASESDEEAASDSSEDVPSPQEPSSPSDGPRRGHRAGAGAKLAAFLKQETKSLKEFEEEAAAQTRKAGNDKKAPAKQAAKTPATKQGDKGRSAAAGSRYKEPPAASNGKQTKGRKYSTPATEPHRLQRDSSARRAHTEDNSKHRQGRSDEPSSSRRRQQQNDTTSSRGKATEELPLSRRRQATRRYEDEAVGSKRKPSDDPTPSHTRQTDPANSTQRDARSKRRRTTKSRRAASSSSEEDEPSSSATSSSSSSEDEEMEDEDEEHSLFDKAGNQKNEIMHGCVRCSYNYNGCQFCRKRHLVVRPAARWKPDDGHPQQPLPTAPTFKPTKQQFEDPIAYISSIMPDVEKYGICRIIPPQGWDPPFALEKGTSGTSGDSFRFSTRKQFTSHLCLRMPSHPAGEGSGQGQGYDRSRQAAQQVQDQQQAQQGQEGQPVPAAQQAQQQQQEGQGQQAQQQAQEQGQPVPGQQAQQQDPAAGASAPASTPAPAGAAQPAAPAAAAAAPSAKPSTKQQQRQEEEQEHDEDEDEDSSFGFITSDKDHNLRSFSSYAAWAKDLHFSALPIGATLPRRSRKKARGKGPRSAAATAAAQLTQDDCDVSIDQMEAEFWRVVEEPEPNQLVETLYGQDLDSGRHGSGFPLPSWRGLPTDARSGRGIRQSAASKTYAEHPWNINNVPRSKNSLLRYMEVSQPITGIMVPWLYVGSCLSAFCWHVEDHALCSINYLHLGAPKVWYGVPSHASAAFNEAMKDALPHLFEADPMLMHKLVTMLSPQELKARGIPVYRLVHEAGSFVITLPNVYHSGFNTGFNVAEAVNFAPAEWLPFGSDVVSRYRDQCKSPSVSHDMLLVTLVRAAKEVAEAQQQAREGGKKRRAKGEQQQEQEQGQQQQSDGEQQQQQQQEQRDDQEQQQPGSGRASESGDGSSSDDEGSNQADEESEDESERAVADRWMTRWRKGKSLREVPATAIQLAAGELSVRVEEERRRQQVAADLGITQQRRMQGDSCAVDEAGVLTNTHDTDCCHCKCDLHLFAVVSSQVLGKAACPEHAAALEAPPDTCAILYRYSLDELEQMVEEATELFPDAERCIAAAHKRIQSKPWMRLKRLGPVVCFPADGEDATTTTTTTTGQQEEAAADKAADAAAGPGVKQEPEEADARPESKAAAKGSSKAGSKSKVKQEQAAEQQQHQAEHQASQPKAEPEQQDQQQEQQQASVKPEQSAEADAMEVDGQEAGADSKDQQEAPASPAVSAEAPEDKPLPPATAGAESSRFGRKRKAPAFGDDVYVYGAGRLSSKDKDRKGRRRGEDSDEDFGASDEEAAHAPARGRAAAGKAEAAAAAAAAAVAAAKQQAVQQQQALAAATLQQQLQGLSGLYPMQAGQAGLSSLLPGLAGLPGAGMLPGLQGRGIIVTQAGTAPAVATSAAPSAAPAAAGAVPAAATSMAPATSAAAAAVPPATMPLSAAGMPAIIPISNGRGGIQYIMVPQPPNMSGNGIRLVNLPAGMPNLAPRPLAPAAVTAAAAAAAATATAGLPAVSAALSVAPAALGAAAAAAAAPASSTGAADATAAAGAADGAAAPADATAADAATAAAAAAALAQAPTPPLPAASQPLAAVTPQAVAPAAAAAALPAALQRGFSATLPSLPTVGATPGSSVLPGMPGLNMQQFLQQAQLQGFDWKKLVGAGAAARPAGAVGSTTLKPAVPAALQPVAAATAAGASGEQKADSATAAAAAAAASAAPAAPSISLPGLAAALAASQPPAVAPLAHGALQGGLPIPGMQNLASIMTQQQLAMLLAKQNAAGGLGKTWAQLQLPHLGLANAAAGGNASLPFGVQAPAGLPASTGHLQVQPLQLSGVTLTTTPAISAALPAGLPRTGSGLQLALPAGSMPVVSAAPSIQMSPVQVLAAGGVTAAVPGLPRPPSAGQLVPASSGGAAAVGAGDTAVQMPSPGAPAAVVPTAQAADAAAAAGQQQVPLSVVAAPPGGLPPLPAGVRPAGLPLGALLPAAQQEAMTAAAANLNRLFPQGAPSFDPSLLLRAASPTLTAQQQQQPQPSVQSLLVQGQPAAQPAASQPAAAPAPAVPAAAASPPAAGPAEPATSAGAAAAAPAEQQTTPAPRTSEPVVARPAPTNYRPPTLTRPDPRAKTGQELDADDFDDLDNLVDDPMLDWG